MYGYQPPAARRLAQLPGHFADGGVVGFGSRGLSQVRDLIPKMQAMGYQQSAPAEPSGAARLRSMIPQMEAMGYKQQPQHLARGGVVRGPGTGTSDSIETEAEPGTFIMPADSTKAIGAGALEKLGTVPVKLSNGEFEFPPEQVMALGAAMLKLLKDTTHTPVNGEDGGQTDAEVGEGMEDGAEEGMGYRPADRMAQMPPMMFADGGLVDNSITRVGNSYSGGSVGGGVSINGQAPGGTVSTSSWTSPAPSPAPAPAPTTVATNTVAPAAPAASPAPAPAAPMGWAERNAQRSNQVTASSIMDSPERRAAQAVLTQPPAPIGYQSATQRLGSYSDPRSSLYDPNPYAASNAEKLAAPLGFQSRRYADGGMVQDDLAKRLEQIPSGGPAGWTGGGASAPAVPALAPVQVAAAPAPLPAAPAAPAGALSRAASMAPAPAPVAPAVAALSALPAADPSPQSEAAAQGLQRRQSADALALMPNAPQALPAPTVRNSTNDWAARKNLENLATAASSITNDRRWGGAGEKSQDRMALSQALATDAALQQAQPGVDVAAMRERGDTQRAGLQVAASSANAAADRMGAMDRTLVTERGNNTRAEIAATGATEAARLKAQQDNKPPAGYRWAAGGKLEPIPGGPAADGKPLTEDQAKSAGYALRMDNALKLIDEIGKSNPGAIRPGLLTAANNALPEGLANQLRPEARQRVESAQLDALDAALTLNTGAAYTREQLQGLSRSYFAQPGDDDKTVADKGNRLQSLIDTARLRAGDKGSAMTDAAQAKNAARTGAAPSAGAPALPGGMTRQVGTSGGRPVYEDGQGNRFIGG
ncbi:MAG: hypothetical protein IV104_13080 [Acidovorax sp.]|nr:hypothetical protein [Acidovorax sp.]